ncbi:FAD-binding and (Fe-S)-binding domain-containing protein [Variovorax soli]|uniref:FAD/FMN-containing dehydrogenase/Fe-S oxidoreductase n=1 Tax=Variovorax soli TaxID=376815 RepID=A0ABU1NDK7_9BURK|nr:FAD-binding and (Fe-S)-binding domain-containing protein [Variovorax soli]MDR6536534.1 FAD/FMN-containing dehydrogenase/Fe-S oxidoreductase [Variovorax soli]
MTPKGAAPRDLDAAALEAELRRSVRGEVRFDAGSRALYATDASNYRQMPIGVVIPRDTDDVVAAVAACRSHGAPLLSRGGGTSLCGQCCNVAIVLDFSKYMNRVLEIDPATRTARVQPGVVLDDLREQAGRHGLTFAPDPATHSHNTLGGMIGNNSCGPHSVMGGETVHNVIALDVLTYDGLRMTLGATDEAAMQRLLHASDRRADIVRRLRELADRHADAIRAKFPPIPRRVSGYNLPALLPENGFDLAKALVGSEGTCVVVLEARLRLLPNPTCRTLLVLGYPSVYEAGDHVPEAMEAGPIALEGLDDRLVSDMKQVHLHPHDVELLPEGEGWLLVEFGADDKKAADEKAQQLMRRLRGADAPPSMKLIDDPEVERHIWRVREAGLGATAHVPDQPITWEGWEDSSVPPARLGEYLRKLRALFDRYGYGCDLYGHFGQGCVHTRIDFDLETAPGIEKYRRFINDAAHLVVACGGSISGEHGDGQSKAELLPIMFGPELVQAFADFKAIWDPQGKMNPGKVVQAYGADENLRLGTAYRPTPVETVLHFAADKGDFARTVLRCVGVGECRKKGGTMCPSYMATGEEMHSTRGRAHLLFEMLNGEREDGVLKQGWKEPAVKEALDLCLSCKACRHECPVKVDMASYKAEFLSHYFEHRRRPLSAHAFGFIDRWSRWASHAPGLANFFTQTAPFDAIGKRIAGIARERRIPAFARQTFRQGFREEAAGSGDRGVLLWPDTFNNHFHPGVAHAAVEVLRHTGQVVRLPPAGLCCGRPLYEFGFLDAARAYLRRIVDALGDDLRAGTPIVVLEPACLSVFKVELPMMLPRDEQARRLSMQSVLLADFLEQHAPDAPFRALAQPALVHGHCHHTSVLGFEAERKLLGKRLGLDVEVPDSGCCGMAGSFGFEAHKYPVSMACGERVLLPAVRQSAPETLVVADGYSCREQIVQSTGRPVLHLAEVLQRAIPDRKGN